MTERTAFAAPRLFDGFAWHDDSAVLVEAGRVAAILRRADLPAGVPVETFPAGMIVPGLVDLQVNGAAGVLLNDAPSVEAIRAICATHAAFGTTALLPTLITSSDDVFERALAAGIAAARQRVPGFIGLHLEGPHLAPAKKGIHDAALMRPMTDADCDRLAIARAQLPSLLVTIAPEAVTPARIARLRQAGIVVSLGHTAAAAAESAAAFAAGATLVTHLFNAMSPLVARQPGLVGATLADPGAHATLIADFIHVAPEAIRIALAAKTGPGRLALISDSMPTLGSALDRFTLDARPIRLEHGALRAADGTLAGSAIALIDAVRLLHQRLAVPLDQVLRMASLYPAEILGLSGPYGHLRPGARADFALVLDGIAVDGVWIEGARSA
jgi:N-acetylglucosamine-6-phosphate deacetylase